MSTDHLNALNLRLWNEKVRLFNAKTVQDKELRAVWVKQIEEEIASELKILGLTEKSLPEMTDDELFAELDKG